jgi:hypothetical protein
MPGAFWQWNGGNLYRPMASVDLGDGMHIYGQLPVGRVVRWNGQAWEQIGQVTGTRNIYSMIGYDDGRGMALYVFGQFDSVNGVQVQNFAKWDGHTWTNPWQGGVTTHYGYALLTVCDLGDGPKLYTNFQPVVNNAAPIGISRWDGSTWQFLGGPSTLGPTFYGLTAFDDGSGPSLYITGQFSNFAGLSAHNLVRYDLTGFHTVPGAISSRPPRASA